MIERYTRPEIGAVWTDEARMTAWRDVEVAAAEALDGPSEADLQAIRTATFTVEAVKERERVTDHDVAAFVDVLGASAGEAGRWIHYGLTSSDVLDTALALQLRRAGDVIVPGARALAAALAERAREFADTVCVGRTHGVHAEPTSFGLKLAGFAFEAHRNAERLERAFDQAATGAISGAVGTYATLGPEYEARVLERLGLAGEPVSTQVVPRDRHAEVLQAVALAGAGLERFATEIRHLQRTEVREVEEPFRAGQKGSSAMPHKRNPITTERITGLARVLRGYAQAGLENVALWHERDISHSGAERVILPDATIALDYMQHLALRVVGGMTVHADRMLANLELTCGALFSQRVLLALVGGGMQRDDAYRIVQRLAQQAWDTQTPLRSLLEAEPGVDLDLDAIFDYGYYTRHVPEVLARLDEVISPSDVLIYGAPDTSPDLFHAIPAGIIDPFLYAEVDGRRAATVSVLDADKVAALGIEIIDPSTLGADELLAQGASRHEMSLEVALRACRALGLERAIVPPEFPVAVADHLRAAGIVLDVDPDAFVLRRRRKTPAQLEGIRRAQKAADAAMAVAARLIHELRPGLTSEEIRAAMTAVCDEHDCDLPGDVIVAHGEQSADGHESGYGALGAGEPVVVDIWPRDRASRCWADMTRTFVAGGGTPDPELAEFWQLTKESLELVYPEVRAGADAQAIFRRSCEPYIAAGQPTQLTKADGEVLRDGYFHGLGHGVGLEIHERPGLGRAPDTLQAGDVITLEPGCYRQGYGGCRLEDLVLVTDDGYEVLTDFPYDL